MKQIFTSYYSSKCSKFPTAVSISASAPDYFRGKRFSVLAPSWEILNAYKEHRIDEEEYARRYLTLLEERGLTPEGVYHATPPGTILLCYEKPGQFCHRRVLAKWMEDAVGVEIPEWISAQEQAKIKMVDDLLVF